MERHRVSMLETLTVRKAKEMLLARNVHVIAENKRKEKSSTDGGTCHIPLFHTKDHIEKWYCPNVLTNSILPGEN